MDRASDILRILMTLQRRHLVLLVLAVFVAVIIGVMVTVLAALQTMARQANELDENRTRQALSGALVSMEAEIAQTLRDYTAWDDAARAVYGPEPDQWINDNYALSDPNSAVFDAAFLLEPDRSARMGYRRGAHLHMTPEAYLSDAFRTLLDRAFARGLTDPGEVTGLLKTTDGPALVGVSPIRPMDATGFNPAGGPRFLVFIRFFDTARIAQMAETYVIKGLDIVAPGAPGARLDMLDMQGKTIGALTWNAQAPGDISYAAVRPMVIAAVANVAAFFIVVILVGSRMMGKLREEEVDARRKALVDPLSGLANRAGLFSALQQIILGARGSGRDVVLLYLDMDGFKEVNDVHGHAAGDRLITLVSQGLARRVPGDAVLARLGGDEFAIAYAGQPGNSPARPLEAIVLDLFSTPFVLGDDQIVSVGASIGTATSRAGETLHAEELLRRADIAMYRAKADGRGRIVAYDEAVDKDLAERKQMEDELRGAVAAGEIHVVYQPIVAASGHAVLGVEALLRWTSPRFGPVSPDVFIGIAERSGIIDQLGFFVLREALAMAGRWPDLAISINISPAQFRNPTFIPEAQRLLAESGVQPSRVTLELTEGYFIQKEVRARDTLNALKRLGVKIALDDFGSGFSSIGYLRRFGFDRMKLDRSMILALDEFPRAGEMLQATLALAASLDIPVTAEGIETREQAAILSLCGCDQLQGYLFSRPVAEEMLAVQLASVAGQRVG